ncbi:F-box-like protein [Ceratobasidium sp. AG-Ba]|nr:F-box-like protein [Ceratobasidium sp. AG-Ba]QRW15026.1 F-box-like protein [Ceratobasidium sp. AG-Ba]
MQAVPDPAAIVRAVLAAVPSDLRAAEAVLDAVVSALCLHLVRVQARISASAPVARIPDDVLVHIFNYACRTTLAAPYASTSVTAAALAGTNRRWRTLMLGHPALWTRIDLRHPSGGWALRYSRRLPIHVRLDAPLWKDARDGPLARVLAPHVPRLRQLWIQTGAPHAEKFLHSIAGQSQLERLTLTGRYTDEHAIGLPPALLTRLRHLSLTHAHLSPSAPPPNNLLTLALKPPPAAPPFSLASLTSLLRASPGLNELSLFGGAVPVYKSPGDEDPSARADLPRLRSLRVSGVGPVQVAWLLFHITYPASTNLTLEMELPRALRTAANDRPRAPHELESYLAALTLFSGEPRERGMPLDTVVISPAVSTSVAPTSAGTQPPSPTDKDRPVAHQIMMERLAAQYTTASATLTLQSGSRATETLIRLVTAGAATGMSGMGGMSKLVLSGVKIRDAVLEDVPAGQEGLSQVRTLEIRACSLAATSSSSKEFAIPQHPTRARAQTQSVPPAPYSTSPTPYSAPPTPVQQGGSPPTPKFGPERSQTFSSYTYTGTNTNKTPHIPSLPLHMMAASSTTPNIPGVPLSTPNLPGVQLVPNAPPAPTPGVSALGPVFTSGNFGAGLGKSLSNLHIPSNVARISAASTPSTPTQNGPFRTEHDTPRANRKSSSDKGEEREVNTAHAPESVYSVGTTHASAGTGSRPGSLSDEDEETEGKKEAGSNGQVAKDDVKVEIKRMDADVDNDSSSSEDEKHIAHEGDEEDETDSNEADGGSELGDLSLDDEGQDGTITPGGRSVRDRPGTPGLRRVSRAATEADVGGSTSSVNGGTTPRLSGGSTPKNGVATASLSSRLNSLRSGMHSASMSNLRAAADPKKQAFTSQSHSASSSNLYAAFKAKDVQEPRSANPYTQGAFGSNGPSLIRGRSTMPTPKQGGFASYATGTNPATFAPVTTTNNTNSMPSQRPSFSTTTAPSRPSFHTFRTPGQPTQTAPRDDDPDSHLLSLLSFHMPSLEEIRIVRSTIRGSSLIRFIEARNGPPLDAYNGYDDTDSGSSDSEDDLERGLRMGLGIGVKKAKLVGPGTPILSLDLLECPYVTADHVRVLRESVDDVRWKPYALAADNRG